ncbi:MAG: hypothetical protein PHD05_00750 [Sphaerochaetaceae bacterium]|nr:hypothetical protein [Sphaerochaetaceae bacterium]
MATDSFKPNVKQIEDDFSNRQLNLDTQIDHLDRFIQDLVVHKLMLENANRQIEILANNERDATKKRYLYKAISENVELLTKVFNSISELENIKYKYHKEIDDILHNKIKLTVIDIQKLINKIDSAEDNLLGFFEKLGNVLSNPQKMKQSNNQINISSNPEYEL